MSVFSLKSGANCLLDNSLMDSSSSVKSVTSQLYLLISDFNSLLLIIIRFYPHNFYNIYRGNQHLIFIRFRLNFSHYLHPFNNFTKGSETLSVGISFSAKIQFGLVTNTDEYFRASCTGLHPCH